MSEALDKARVFLDAGNHKKAIAALWDAEVPARGDLAAATALLELAEEIRDGSDGRKGKDVELLIGYARSHMQRLSSPRPTPRRRGFRCVVLGGFGWELTAGEAYEFDFDSQGLALYQPPGRAQAAVSVTYRSLLAIEIGGLGAATSGGGFAGGGVGAQGAIEGMLAAGVLNALSTRSKVITTFSLHTRDAEAFFLHEDLPPQDLRIQLSEVFVRMRQTEADAGERD